MPIKLDLHVHSESRGKVFINAQQLICGLKENCLDGVAITNFFSISHALWLKEKIRGYIIIVGQEIWTKDGHIIGLGLNKKIKDFQDAQQTIEEIHGQGGIAVAAHPYLHLGLGRKIMSFPVDGIEVYNALIGPYITHNYLAKMTAAKTNITQLASTDTSNAEFIGRSYTEVDNGGSGILEAIRLGRVRLFKRPLPIPFAFMFKNFFRFRNLEPCPLHAVPCSICGKSITFRLFKKSFRCLECKKVESSYIACCNGHYLCLDCSAESAFQRGGEVYYD